MADSSLSNVRGTVAVWDGRFGHVLTDRGEMVPFNLGKLWEFGFRSSIDVGYRIYFSALTSACGAVSMSKIRLIVPDPLNEAELDRLEDKYAMRERALHENLLELLRVRGIVDSFDAARGSGWIVSGRKPKIHLHVTALRAAGHKRAEAGMHVRCEVAARSDGWQAFRILSLNRPPPS